MNDGTALLGKIIANLICPLYDCQDCMAKIGFDKCPGSEFNRLEKHKQNEISDKFVDVVYDRIFNDNRIPDLTVEQLADALGNILEEL